ncbi:MAG: hypothetical protein P8N40_10525 [Gammaproteobacteria bacterium]|nr:hypothetical protein [Gammaproteobacteria bacterium]
MNGPENISKYLRVPIPDQPVLGVLRMSPPKARELNLSPGQIVRGLVSEDGKSVEFLLGNVKQEINSDLDKWQGKAIEFKVNIDNAGSHPAEKGSTVAPSSYGHKPSDQSKQYPLHPKSLLILLSNPTFFSLNFLKKIQFNSLVEWLKSFHLPSSSLRMFSSLVYSAKKVDVSLLKKQLRNNGYKYISKNSSISDDSGSLTIKNAMSILLKNLEEQSRPGGNEIKASDLTGFMDYLDANAIEYIVKQEQNEVGIRFMLLFADFPSVELYIEGENLNPKAQDAYKWSIEVKFNLDTANIWGKIQLVSEGVVAVDFLISNSQITELANANLKHLYGLFRAEGIELARCNISEGRHLESVRKDILKERGNLELSA